MSPPGSRQPWLSQVMRSAEPSSRRGSPVFSVSESDEGKSIHHSKSGLNWACLVLVTQARGSWPALHVYCGALAPCSMSSAVTCCWPAPHRANSSPQGCHLYLISPHKSSILSNSFHHLQYFDQDTSNVMSSFLQDSYFSSFSLISDFFQESLQPPGRASHPLPASEDVPHLGWRSLPVWSWSGCSLTEEAYHMGSEGRQQQVPELRAWLFSGLRSRASARGGLGRTGG